jgi:uncharacterized protein with beta-barrel porin domain
MPGLIMRLMLAIALLCSQASYGKSPNGPPGPEGNPTPPSNGNGQGNQGTGNNGNGQGNMGAPTPTPPPESTGGPPSSSGTPTSSPATGTTAAPTDIPPTTSTGAPVPPAPPPESPEGRSNRHALLRLALNIFDPNGNVSPTLLTPAIQATANVSGLASAMSQEAQGEAAATNTNIDGRMSQIRDAAFDMGDASYHSNVFLTIGENRKRQSKLGLWVVGTGIFSYSEGTRAKTGTVTAGADYFINKYMVVGVLGVYGYSDSRIPGIKGHLLGNSKIGGIYFGAWTGKPGFHLTLSGLVNSTDFTLIQAASPGLLNWTGFASIGYQTDGETWAFGPVASLQFDNANTNGFTLSGLDLHRNVTNTLQSRVGATIIYKKFVWKPKLQLMWEHHYSGSSAIDVEYAGIPDTRASIGKGASSRDSFWGSFSVIYPLRAGWSLQGSYNCDIGNRFSVQQVNVAFNVNF